MKLRFKKLFAVFMMVFVFFSVVMVPTESYAAAGKTKSMTSYFCVKKGNIVYCANYEALYRVDLKTKKVKKIATDPGYIEDLKIKGNYVYYAEAGSGVSTSQICRVNIKTEKRQILVKNVQQFYAISGNKIYYTKGTFPGGKLKIKSYCMKLNGKSKKACKVKIKRKVKESDTKGYKVFRKKTKEEYLYDFYLQTPTSSIFLERTWAM